MTAKQFSELGSGDILIFRNGVVRTILEGPRDIMQKRGWISMAITMPIRRRSWTNRAITVQGWHDLKHKLKGFIRREHAPLMLKAEAVRLKEIGFDVRKETKREAREEIKFSNRRGFLVCSRILRLAK